MAADDKLDQLSLVANAAVAKMLSKHGQNLPKKEEVVLSDFVIKVNRKGREQTRVLLVTDKAIYNLMPNDYSNCKRRIALERVGAITASTMSDEFVLHVPEEYDYHFKSQKKKQIIACIVARFADLAKANNTKPAKLNANFIDRSDLKDMAMTKAMARLQSREDILKRRRDLIASEKHDSDNEEEREAKEAKDTVSQLLDNTEKVRLEDFELLKVLGRGSFGKVMQVRKKSDGKIYAMKILKKRAIIARNQVEHTKAERKILESLQHPFLMTLRYAFQTKDKLYFVLDYFQGGELFFHLKAKRRFPEEVARLYVAEIALALGHLHALNIIYRDLKPENILLDDSGHVCLTDFGLSKDYDPDNPDDKAHTFCGTPEYLAPEIVSGVGHDKAVDWWSLGILLYELTVGIPPFYAQNVNEMYTKIQTGVLRFPPFVSDDCKALIVGLLQRDPKKRLGSENDVDDIKRMAFFKPINWERLMRKEIESPYKPRIKSAGDTSNFDETFTAEPAVDSVADRGQLSKTLAQNQDAFSGFTFTQQSNLK